MTGSGWRRPTSYSLIAALAVGGCAVTGPYELPKFAFPGSYQGAQQTSPVLLANDAWWKRFGDPTLDALVTRAMSGNLDLERAKERVNEARASARAVPATVSVSPQASYRREGIRGQGHDQAGVGVLDFDWLLDPWGARREQVKAAGARVEAADAELDAARLLVLQNLGQAYVDLRYQERMLALRQGELASRRETRALINRLSEAGEATKLDLVNADALVAETEAELPSLRAGAENARTEVAILTGSLPGAAPVELSKGRGRQPRVSLSPEVGIPADLLRNRPDIRIAERFYAAAVSDAGAARAALYPRLSLSGAITLSGLRTDPNAEYWFGPVLTLPALPDSPRRGAADAADAKARQAHVSWKNTVLGAIGDVEKALVDYSAAISSVRASERTVRLYGEAAGLTRQLVGSGDATVRDLIEAEQAISRANMALAQNVRLLGRSFVTLNVSLGSGYRVAGVPVAVSK